MPRTSIEQRVSKLESRLAELQAQVQAANGPAKDWRRTIGAFSDDPGMQDILRAAMRLREADRKKARRPAAKRKPV